MISGVDKVVPQNDQKGQRRLLKLILIHFLEYHLTIAANLQVKIICPQT